MLSKDSEWSALAESVIEQETGYALSVLSMDRVVKTGRRVKLTGTLANVRGRLPVTDPLNGAEWFEMVLANVRGSWVPVELCIKLHGGMNWKRGQRS